MSGGYILDDGCLVAWMVVCGVLAGCRGDGRAYLGPLKRRGTFRIQRRGGGVEG